MGKLTNHSEQNEDYLVNFTNCHSNCERWGRGEWRRGSGEVGERRGAEKKKKIVCSANTRRPARSTPHLRPNSAQAATSHGSGGNVAVRSNAALPTPTQLSAPAGMTGGAWPRSQPTRTVTVLQVLTITTTKLEHEPLKMHT